MDSFNKLEGILERLYLEKPLIPIRESLFQTRGLNA